MPSLAVVAVALLTAAPIQAETPDVSNPVLDEPAQAVTAPGAAAPAYRFVEGMSDGVFNFMRLHVIGAVLPERLTRSLKAAPREDSAPLFDRNLHDNEVRYLDRARAAYPITGEGAAPANVAQLRVWRSWAAAEQVSVAVDSFKDTMVERYQLELFGESSGEYAMDRRHWDTGFLSMAGILGGTFLYLNGMHASSRVGALNLGIDLASGLKLRQAFQGGDAHNLAGFELRYKDKPITLATEWGLSGGRMKNERIGLNYRLRY